MLGVKVGWQNGVVISTKHSKVILDPVGGRWAGRNTHIFITHAHADHTYGLRTNTKKYATPETVAIYEKLNAKRLDNIVPLRINKTVKIGDIEVTAIHAGHMLGSAQFLVTTPEKTVLYTGDINCVDTLTTQAAQAAECDELIMEATYGDPFYTFPNRHKIYARIVEWATTQARKNRSPIFHAYAAGKGQEIVKLFNVYTTLPVVVNPSISRVNQAHSDFGVKLDYFDTSNRKTSEVLNGVHVLVTTTRDESVTAERSIRALATGWALKMRSRHFPSFPLSSHADFRQLTDYVKATRAKRVYLYTGFTDVLSEFLVQKFALDAKPLPPMAQTELRDF